MEAIKSRFSMNTSLKNARIFDEDSNDEEMEKLVNEAEIKEELEELAFNPFPLLKGLKTKEVIMKAEIKQELFDEDTNFPISSETFENMQVKKELLEELGSPMKIDAFGSPMKIDGFENSDSNSRKSLRNAKINFLKKRDSPYKAALERLTPSSSKISKPSFDENSANIPKKKIRKNALESDPGVLSRRQKQIDYGKNTTGYDKYCELVPKHQRKADDPQTPNKYLQYSRRGWDGLIKQWRLKLHKYDPEENA